MGSPLPRITSCARCSSCGAPTAAGRPKAPSSASRGPDHAPDRSPGLQIWGAYGIDKDGNNTLVGNVTITGASSVVGATGSVGEDADEANGKDNTTEATQLIPIVSDRPESIWPAGDQDYYFVYAHPGDVITATAKPTAIDFRNDLDPVVQVFSNNGDILATASAPRPERRRPSRSPQPATATVLKPFMILVSDRSGSVLDRRIRRVC